MLTLQLIYNQIWIMDNCIKKMIPPWPKWGKMRYVKIIDDDRVLDGQDYSKAWRLVHKCKQLWESMKKKKISNL